MVNRLWVVGLVCFATVLPANWGAACPFCSAVSQTLRQEITSMDTAVIAEALDPAENKEEGKIRLRVVRVLKGEEIAKVGLEIEAAYFGKVTAGRHFMLTGVDPPKIIWSSPLAVAEKSEKYLETIMSLEDDALVRLKYYQQFLEDEDPMLARDAYDEFAVAPYAEVKALGPHMMHDKLMGWIQSEEISPDRKRLYLTMIGICGTEKDLPIIESMLTSTQASTRSGLDALIACYLCLKGPTGLELVDQHFLANKTTEYSETYSAIQALRFHGTETNVIPRERLVSSLALILERKDLADLVIPDLSRWEDWTQIERMVKLFKDADPSDNFVRVPVVNYLRACPKPEAKEALKELEKIDPVSVRRANTFFPVPNPASPPKPTTSYVPSVGATVAANASSIDPQPVAMESVQSMTTPQPEVPLANPFSLLAVFASAGSSLFIVYWLVLVG